MQVDGSTHTSGARRLHAISLEALDPGRPVQPLRLPRRERLLGGTHQILGGVLLNQERAQPVACCSSWSSRLCPSCMCVQEFCSGARLEAVQPFGIDPAFDETTSFHSRLASSNSHTYFNTSIAAAELSYAGIPYAFFPRQVSSIEDAFPVVFEVRINYLSQLQCCPARAQ